MSVARDVIAKGARQSRLHIRGAGFTPIVSMTITLGRKGSELAVSHGAATEGVKDLTPEGCIRGGTLLAQALAAEIAKLQGPRPPVPEGEEGQ